jgi:hypothetical protein
MKHMLPAQLFAKKLYTGFYKNPTNGSVADMKYQRDGRTDGLRGLRDPSFLTS